MFDIFMKSPVANSLAVAVLLALIFSWFVSLIFAMRSESIQMDQGWYAKLIPGFSFLGILAALDLFRSDGYVVIIVAIVFMVFLANMVIPFLKNRRNSSWKLLQDWYQWSVLITCVGGLLVAGYLSYVHFSGAVVACGPSGGCDSVQSSRYATLFGVHVSMIGLVGYVGILLGWLAWKFGPVFVRKIAPLAIWAMCFIGVLFSAYLTFLEPFVLGATCMWCIFSAVLMIILLLASTPFAQQTFSVEED